MEERYVPGRCSPRVEADHLARFTFCSQLIRSCFVLDVACGSGIGTEIFARKGALRVIGADTSLAAIRSARINLVAVANAFFVVANMEELPFATQFDAIVCLETIEHVQNPGRAIRELYRLLPMYGFLLLSTPNRRVTSPRVDNLSKKPTNPFHQREYVVSELLELLERSGFPCSMTTVYGQRQRFWVPTRVLRRLQSRILKPEVRSSPEVKKLRWGRHPRYYVFISRKS